MFLRSNFHEDGQAFDRTNSYSSGATFRMSNLIEIPVAKIRENVNALRKVNREKEGYRELVSSISKSGVLQPVLVRELKDDDTGEMFYGLIDGLHRLTASIDAGKTTIPCHVKNMEDADVMYSQIMTNVHKVETQHSEYAKQLHRILALKPTLTVTELANDLGKSTKWLNDRLSLSKLTPEIQKLVDSSQITLLNAYQLAKLPDTEQANYVDRAMTDQPSAFVPVIAARVKELNEAKRQGREANKTDEFVPHAVIRKMSELKDEVEKRQAALTIAAKFTNPVDAFHEGVKWAVQLDADSVALAKEREAARKKQAAEAVELRRKEREAARAKEAAEKAASLQAELV